MKQTFLQVVALALLLVLVSAQSQAEKECIQRKFNACREFAGAAAGAVLFKRPPQQAVKEYCMSLLEDFVVACIVECRPMSDEDFGVESDFLFKKKKHAAPKDLFRMQQESDAEFFRESWRTPASLLLRNKNKVNEESDEMFWQTTGRNPASLLRYSVTGRDDAQESDYSFTFGASKFRNPAYLLEHIVDKTKKVSKKNM